MSRPRCAALLALLVVAATSPGCDADLPPVEADPPPEVEAQVADGYGDARNALVDRHIVDAGIRDAATISAMRSVPRHEFVPVESVDRAYDDYPLPIGYGQTISQPYIVAYMTELLALDAEDRVLEIGTGSGYQAAVLAEITPHVYTIEILKPLADLAAVRLRRLGYGTVKARNADGYFGWPEHGPFDAIIVTCASGHVPPPLVEQLKPGGRMVIPVGGVFDVQYIVLVTKEAEGGVRSNSVLPVRFVPMTGRAEEGA